MMLISTRVGPSQIHGLGVYTLESIAKGQIIWRFVPSVDQFHSFDEIKAMPVVAQKFFETYGYPIRSTGRDGYYLDCDNGRYMNHSFTPNAGHNGDNDLEYIALFDISAGEELTCNYAEFEPEFVDHYMIPASPQGLNGSQPVLEEAVS